MSSKDLVPVLTISGREILIPLSIIDIKALIEKDCEAATSVSPIKIVKHPITYLGKTGELIFLHIYHDNHILTYLHVYQPLLFIFGARQASRVYMKTTKPFLMFNRADMRATVSNSGDKAAEKKFMEFFKDENVKQQIVDYFVEHDNNITLSRLEATVAKAKTQYLKFLDESVDDFLKKHSEFEEKEVRKRVKRIRKQ